MSNVLKPDIDHTFSCLIWKLETDVATGLLFVETRNEKEQFVGFSSFNLKKEETNFLEFSVEEKWLVGMEGGRKGILFLHGYKSEQTPEHKGIIAINGFSGEQLWADYNFSVEAFKTEGLLAADQRFQTKRTIFLDYKTGNRITKPNNMQDEVQEIQVPHILRLLPQNLSAIINGTITGEISCLNYNSYLIISLHTQSAGKLLQELFIIENEVVVYRDLLNENIQKLQPEAFVMIKNCLIYLKNKITLKVLNL